MSLDWIDDELRRLEDADLFRRRVIRSGKLAATIVVDGKRYTNFGSNDYLGLAADAELSAAIAKAVSRGGWGSGSSPLIVGRSADHAELERHLATWMNCEAALLFPTGFAANMGTIPALIRKGDVVFSDASNHASIIAGCRLSGARIAVYAHGGAEQLETLLAQESSSDRKLIVTDGLFSMEGDFAPLRELVELANRHRAMLLVDEAHALGVVGTDGRGTAEYWNVAACVDVRVGTLSKALGCHGGFVAGNQSLIDYLSNCAGSYVYSTAAPAAASAAALAALKILRDQPQRRVRLAGISELVRNSLATQGWNIGRTVSHIVPVIVGEVTAAIEMAARLREQGIWAPCIRPPSVPPGNSLLRISLSSMHTDAMIEHLLDALAKLRRS